MNANWSEDIYLCFPDEAAARALATSLGVDFPDDGTIPTGNGNYAMHAPMQAPWATPPVFNPYGELVTPGIPEPGFWALLRLNTEWIGFTVTMAAIEAAGVRRDLAAPPVVFA